MILFVFRLPGPAQENQTEFYLASMPTFLQISRSSYPLSKNVGRWQERPRLDSQNCIADTDMDIWITRSSFSSMQYLSYISKLISLFLSWFSLTQEAKLSSFSTGRYSSTDPILLLLWRLPSAQIQTVTLNIFNSFTKLVHICCPASQWLPPWNFLIGVYPPPQYVFGNLPYINN